MKPIAVIGIGNRLMMDDGVGVLVVEELANRQRKKYEGIHYIVGETDLDYCLDAALDAERLIVVDAAMAGNQPSAVTPYPLQEMGLIDRGISLHHLHFLHMVQHFDRHKGVLIGIEPFQIDFQFGLSEGMKASFDQVVSRVEGIIHELANQWNQS